MKPPAFLLRNACQSLNRSLNPSAHWHCFPSILTSVSKISRNPPRSFSAAPPSSPMADGDAGGGTPPPSSLSCQPTASVEKQFESFHSQLQESGILRERIRAVAAEIESTTRIMHAGLLLVHQSRPVSEVLEKSKAQIGVLKEIYRHLADIIDKCPGQYYRYHGDWRSETQTVVSQLAFMHWLETGSLLLHADAEEKLGLNNSEFGLDIEDYLIGVCFMSNDLPRYVVNRVTCGDYDCPGKVLNFLTDLHAAFRMLNLRNDFLRKKFDSMKYDLRKVEEVHYDVKIRGLGANAESLRGEGTQGRP